MLGKPLINWVVDAAKEAGVTNLVSVVGHEREQVTPLVEGESSIVVQKQLLGTADAIRSCREHYSGFEGSLLVLSGDCPLISAETIRELIEQREEANAAVAVLSMELEAPFGYGRIVRNARGEFERIVEQKDCTPEQAAITECNSGFYCFDAQELFCALDRVGNENAQGEFYLTDVVEICRNYGRPVAAIPAKDVDECLGINSRVQLAQATKLMQRRINEGHMMAGVTMTDPDLVWIGPDVQIECDVALLPMTTLAGATTVGEDSVIGPNSRLVDTRVGKGCVVEETIAIEARIDDEATCGPRAYLRPGAHLCRRAKAGTHVEIKKSVVGEGSKVPHLSYIGDATIGVDVNIGAGTITCNYDGMHKHHTVIGDEVFIGSDTMLVAPVNLGDRSMTGAGSVITKNVSPDALALGRAKQTEIAGYRKRNEEG